MTEALSRAEALARAFNAAWPVGSIVALRCGSRSFRTKTKGRAFAFPGSGPVPEGAYIRVASKPYAVALELVEPIAAPVVANSERAAS